MAYGLRVINDTQYLQIDENWVTYALTESGTTAAFSGTPSSPDSISVNLTTGNYPLMFVSPNSTWGSNVKEIGVHHIGNNGKNFTLMPTWTGTLNYRAYELVSTLVSGSGYGLEIWDGSGDLAFSSNYEMARIKYKANSIPGGAASSSFSTSGPLPYAFISGLGWYSRLEANDPDPGEDEYESWFWATNGLVSMSSIILEHNDPTTILFGNDSRVRLLAAGG